MENIGSFALLLALALSVYSLAASAIGAVTRKAVLVQSGARATMAMWALVTLAMGLLSYVLMTDQFRLAYVAAHSNKDLPAFYKFASLWSGQEGSLLMWSWILATYSMLIVVLHRNPEPAVRPMMPWVNACMMISQAFFLYFNAIVASPFSLLAATGVGAVNGAIPDGRGLNPLLQHPAMVIHPPILYLGYVGFAVPFAFAVATLITRPRGEEWIHVTRKWTMVTWMFQGMGVLLGAAWAYEVLGWGGYWGWDPVENASLMPWILSTAFLHSVMMQEKKGMLKWWNMALVMSTYYMCIFGTFLTRSGVVSSVHAFANSPVGSYFAWFLGAGMVAGAILLYVSRDYLRAENHLESLVSREAGFLFNNLILLAACFAILWGTMFPVISEAVTNQKISVGAPFFNKVNIPVGLFLLFLTGVGPLLAWRKTSLDGFRRNFVWPAAAAAVFAVALVALGMRNFYATVCFALSLFVVLTIAQEFWKGAAVIARKQRINAFLATVELTLRNTRRYGGYVVHFGMVLIFVGLGGAAFTAELETEMKPGSTAEIRGYRLVCKDLAEDATSYYATRIVTLDVYRGDTLVATMKPEQRVYRGSGQPVTVVKVKRSLKEDFYVVYKGNVEESRAALIHVYVNPLVNWIWLGGLVVVLGTGIALIPSRRNAATMAQAPRSVAEPAAVKS